MSAATAYGTLACVLSLTSLSREELKLMERALSTVRAEDLQRHAQFLASDALRGRCAGEEGCDQAADYLVNQFRGIGLEPALADQEFLQCFEFPARGGKGKQAKTSNVIAVWKGEDPKQREEFVVLGAHFDHVGTSESMDTGRAGGIVGEDTVWNGADDNASGTAAVLEVAEALVKSGLRMHRSIVFVLFSAEEQGLNGSRYYCSNPVADLSKTVCMINLDMVGRNPEVPLEISGIGTLREEVWSDWIQSASKSEPSLELKLLPDPDPGSDDYSFVSAGVPAIALFSGYHEDYHRATDHVDKLDFARMQSVTRFVVALVQEAGNSERELSFEMPMRGSARGKELGVGPGGELSKEELAELGLTDGQGAYRVKSIRSGSVAETAGLRVNDVILSVGGIALRADETSDSFRRAVKGAPFNQDVALLVLREGERVELKFRFQRRR